MENSLIQNTNSLKNLPSDWRVFPFTNLIDDVSGGNLKTQKSEFLENGLIPIIDQGKDLIAGYIDDENVIVKTKTPHIVFGDHTRILKYIDFPFAMGADGTKVLKVKSNIEALEKYVYYFFQTLNIPETGYNRHFKYLKECLIPLPNLATQQKIAIILDKADELRQYNKQLIEKYDALTQSLFLDMFGDPVRNEKGWEVKAFGTYISVLTDYHANGSYESLKEVVELKDDKDFALMVRTTDLEKNNFNDNVKYITEEAYNYLTKSKVFGNEIIINKIGSAGNVFLMPVLNRPVSLGMNAFLLRFNETNLNILFTYFLLKTKYGETEIQKRVKGAVTKTIRKDAIREIPIIVPPIDLQNQFAERVAVIETQKQQAQEALAKSEALFQGLLQQAFNGELNTPPYGHPS